MFELGEFHLQLALVGPGALGEDIENEARAVEDAALEGFFEVAFLTGREVMVEDDQIGGMGVHLIVQFLDLAGTDEITRGRLTAIHRDERHGLRTRRSREFEKLLRIFARLGMQAFQMDQNGPLTTFVTLEEQQGAPLVIYSLSDSLVSELGRRTGRLGTTVEIACL